MSMCLRVAHEVTHSWFGLLVGAKDPTEEWLTEGFCSYMEDFLHASVETFEPASNVEVIMEGTNDAFSHLYKRARPSVGSSFHLSIRVSVMPFQQTQFSIIFGHGEIRL